MLTTKRLLNALSSHRAFATLALALVVATSLIGASSAHADASPVFLTRNGVTISAFPRNNAFQVGTSTAAGQVATTTLPKLGVTLNPSDAFLGNSADGWKKAFGIASTTTVGGTATSTANLLSVSNTGCVQLTSTSSATQIKLQLSNLGATSTFSGTAYWNYGTCP